MIDTSYLPDNDTLPNYRSGCCFEYMYGITFTIAESIQETCRLSEYIARYEASCEEIPDTLLQACEMLGDRLLSWSLSLEKVTSFPSDNTSGSMGDDAKMRTIFNHHAGAWHMAALIYYYQCIQRFRVEDLQEEIGFVAEHMHAVEDLKAACRSDRARRMAPITWPAFVASCDAAQGGQNRASWRRWWERVQQYNIANIQRQWETVQQIWRRKDELEETGCASQSWLQIFHDLEFHLLLI
ncbi:hypothetical protein SLS62_007362 [Diatrype stigma]|uniref:Uncharacterized protein n=1 Tax=Diatrype stigma TaxID=117547 RepID=A0AAN9YQC0_9PEZI